MMRKALFLDKDGVINIDHGYVCSPERTDFMDGIFGLCRAATQHGYLNVVVTNQAGIARGYYSERDFHAYMDWVRKEFLRNGAQIDAMYFCPHHPTTGFGGYLCDCECRKPKPGMLLRAIREMNLDVGRSVMLGDKLSDMEAAQRAGTGRRILLEQHREQAELEGIVCVGTHAAVIELLR